MGMVGGRAMIQLTREPRAAMVVRGRYSRCEILASAHPAHIRLRDAAVRQRREIHIGRLRRQRRDLIADFQNLLLEIPAHIRLLIAGAFISRKRASFA